MEEGSGDNLMRNSSGAPGAAGAAGVPGYSLSDCSAPPEETVKNFLEQVSSSYSLTTNPQCDKYHHQNFQEKLILKLD